MPRRPPVDPARVAYWRDLAQRISAAGHGERSALVDAAAAANGLASRDAVYRRLRELGGWDSGRKRRADAGARAVDQETLHTIAGIYREGARRDGRRIMSIDQAVEIAEASGHTVPVSVGQVARYLRHERLDARSQARAEHFTELRSLHPNHVHQIDPSLCVLYWMKGRQHILREQDFYKNKLDRLAKLQDKVWRYVRYDHASGEVDVRYYLGAGESQALMFEFLVWTWGRQAARVSHGVPKILMWDAGSANTSHGIQRLLEALDVEQITHLPGRPNVKGGVEQANLLVERGFESRLRFEPVDHVDALNAAAETWARAWNANQIPRIDSRVQRAGAEPLVRTALWMRIRPEQIRELPAREVCARLLEGKPETRVVRPQAFITYPHPAIGRAVKYSVRTIAELHRGDTVEVSPLLIGDDGTAGLIRLRFTAPSGQVHTWRLAPELELDDFGRPLSAPVIGETFAQPATRASERAAADLDRAAYPRTPEQRAEDPDTSDSEHARRARDKNITPFGGRLSAHRHLADIQTPVYLPRRGQEIDARAPEDTAAPVPLVRALARLRDAWERPLTRDESRWLATRYGDAIPETELARLAAAGPSSESQQAAIS